MRDKFVKFMKIFDKVDGVKNHMAISEVEIIGILVYYVYYLISTFAHEGLRTMPKHALMDQLLT
jgi:hypothetical protein